MAAQRGKRPTRRHPSKILVIDIGGTSVKLLVTGEVEPRNIDSGSDFTPAKLIDQVGKICRDWRYDAVSIGYPGRVGGDGPHSEPGNLGPGWVGFNFAAAFDRPVRILNDAAMQALGSYDGGRMLFLGLGTGVGSTLIAESVIVPLELGDLPFRSKKTLSAQLGRDGLERLGKPAWRKRVARVVEAFVPAFNVDYIVLGGGNAKLVNKLPPSARLGHNQSAFRGGFRLWNLPDVATLLADGETQGRVPATDWRVI